MTDYLFRRATREDLASIASLLTETKAYFKTREIPQWQGDYPAIGDFEKDIARGECYLALNHEQEVMGMVVVSLQPEPNYERIYAGGWHYEQAATVIHRLAVSQKARGRGIAKKLMTLAEEVSLKAGRYVMRVDTHQLNENMQGLVKRCGFKFAGRIDVADGTPRQAFDKHIAH